MVAAAFVAACAVKLAPPPSLFPVTNAWKAAVGGLIEPPLATDGTLLFVATRDGLLALNLSDGKQAWKARGRGRVSAREGIVLLREGDGRVRRLDPATGAEQWRVASGVNGELPAAIDGDLVFVAGDGLAALSTGDGHKVWSSPEKISSLPVASGSQLFTGEEDGTVRRRDRATGTSRWTFASVGAVKAPVFVDGDHALVGTSDRRFLALRAKKGTPRWRWKVGADITEPGSVLGHAALFVSYDNILYAVGRGNGHLRWRGVLPSRAISGPVLTGNAVVVACLESDILGFDGRSGRSLGALKTPAEIRTPPLVIGDRLYVGLRDRTVVALALDQTPAPDAAPSPTPAPKASTPPGATPPAAPAGAGKAAAKPTP